MLKLLVIGGTGMLGHKLVQTLGQKFDVYCTIRREFERVERFAVFDDQKTISGIDLESQELIQRAVKIARPDVVINAAGVIKQLPASADVVSTLTINSILPHRLYELSREHGFRLILISTDCVFDGRKGDYTEADPPDSRDLYGISKSLGEIMGSGCLTIRSSFIGRELETCHSLVEWFLSNRGGKVKGFTKAIYSGFPTVVFADIIANLLVERPGLEGLYHISSEPIDKFTLLSLVAREYRADIEIEPDNSFLIDRSLNSSRFCEATGFVPPSWEEMIQSMAADTTPYDKWRERKNLKASESL
jgi:dTDP-4-dehydrorhamnose reductase